MTSFVQIVQSKLNCEFSESHFQTRNVSLLKHELQSQILGAVAAPWDAKYEYFRKIHNKACCQKPLLIARPRSQKVNKSSRKRNYDETICSDIINTAVTGVNVLVDHRISIKLFDIDHFINNLSLINS